MLREDKEKELQSCRKCNIIRESPEKTKKRVKLKGDRLLLQAQESRGKIGSYEGGSNK